ncbi:MAG: DUF3786 domain-containing protein [Candidatus Omnitrophota bacterium]
MGYEAAINKAWEELFALEPKENLSARFLADEYSLDLKERKVLSLSCNVPAKDFTSILILHYLIQELKGLPAITNEWLTFRELSGIEGYYPAFRKRAIEPIIRKYGEHPEAILSVLERLPAKRIYEPDVSIVIEAFIGVPVLIKLMHKDEEFGPDANLFFDKSVTRIFCTEDIVVLAGLVAGSL